MNHITPQAFIEEVEHSRYASNLTLWSLRDMVLDAGNRASDISRELFDLAKKVSDILNDPWMQKVQSVANIVILEQNIADPVQRITITSEPWTEECWDLLDHHWVNARNGELMLYAQAQTEIQGVDIYFVCPNRSWSEYTYVLRPEDTSITDALGMQAPEEFRIECLKSAAKIAEGDLKTLVEKDIQRRINQQKKSMVL